ALDQVVTGYLIEAEDIVVVEFEVVGILDADSGGVAAIGLGDHLRDGLYDIGAACAALGDEGPTLVQRRIGGAALDGIVAGGRRSECVVVETIAIAARIQH